jgi:hypothetical protein
VIAVVLLAATLLVAPHRLRALVAFGLGLATAMVVLRAGVDVVVERAPNLAAQPGGRVAIEVLIAGATTSLMRLTGIVLLCGLAVAVITFLARRRPQIDLVMFAAFAVGSATIAIGGLSLPSALVAVVLSLAVPVVVHLLTTRSPAPPTAAPACSRAGGNGPSRRGP